MKQVFSAIIGYCLVIPLAYFAYDQISEFYELKNEGIHHSAKISEREHLRGSKHGQNFRYTADSHGSSYTISTPFYKEIGDTLEFFHVPGTPKHQVLYGTKHDSISALLIKNMWYTLPFAAVLGLLVWLIITIRIWVRHNK